MTNDLKRIVHQYLKANTHDVTGMRLVLLELTNPVEDVRYASPVDLKNRIRKSGYKIRDLAKVLGISGAAVSYWIRKSQVPKDRINEVGELIGLNEAEKLTLVRGGMQ